MAHAIAAGLAKRPESRPQALRHVAREVWHADFGLDDHGSASRGHKPATGLETRRGVIVRAAACTGAASNWRDIQFAAPGETGSACPICIELELSVVVLRRIRGDPS